MTIKLSSFGGGGSFTADNISGLITVPGATPPADFISVTPASGKKLVLSELSKPSGTTSDVEIYFGARLVWTGTLGTGDLIGSNGTHISITGKADEQLRVTRTTGVDISSDVQYSYEEGE